MSSHCMTFWLRPSPCATPALRPSALRIISESHFCASILLSSQSERWKGAGQLHVLQLRVFSAIKWRVVSVKTTDFIPSSALINWRKQQGVSRLSNFIKGHSQSSQGNSGAARQIKGKGRRLESLDEQKSLADVRVGRIELRILMAWMELKQNKEYCNSICKKYTLRRGVFFPYEYCFSSVRRQTQRL